MMRHKAKPDRNRPKPTPQRDLPEQNPGLVEVYDKSGNKIGEINDPNNWGNWAPR